MLQVLVVDNQKSMDFFQEQQMECVIDQELSKWSIWNDISQLKLLRSQNNVWNIGK